jgi:TatD DNase family protein
MSGLIDTHTHLDGFARHGELPAVLERARAAGLEAMIAIGTEPGDWALYRELARERAGVVYYTVGLHPCSVAADWEQAIAQMEGFWGRARPPGAPNDDTAGPAVPPYRAPSRPVALGETGLDRFHLPKDAAAAERVFGWQRAAFAAGLEMAKRLEVPVVVHSRGAFHECVEMIDASGVDWTRVVFHCFSEGAEEMNALVRRGGFGSFTGIITYKNADAIRAAARAQGLARLMIETDAPYLAPLPHRGEPNEPAFVCHTAEFCAGLFGVGYEELAAVTTENARRFFGL